MTHRRHFLQSIAATLMLAPVRFGLGEVKFCRVPHPGWLRIVPPGCIAEVDPAAGGATFLGNRATLVISAKGYQVFGAQ